MIKEPLQIFRIDSYKGPIEVLGERQLSQQMRELKLRMDGREKIAIDDQIINELNAVVYHLKVTAILNVHQPFNSRKKTMTVQCYVEKRIEPTEERLAFLRKTRQC